MQTYPIDTQTLGLIEVAVFGVLEGLRYNNYKKTGSVSWHGGSSCGGGGGCQHE